MNLFNGSITKELQAKTRGDTFRSIGLAANCVYALTLYAMATKLWPGVRARRSGKIIFSLQFLIVMH